MSKHTLPAILRLPLGLRGATLWNYTPRTSWFTHFITINNNSNDAPIEEHVLSDVGSYGLQLGKVLDALDVLIELVPTSSRCELSLEQQGQLADLVKLRAQVKAVTSQY